VTSSARFVWSVSLLVVLGAGCSATTRRSGVSVRITSSQPSGVSVTQVASLGDSYPDWPQLVADPSGSGVFYWMRTSGGIVMARADGSGVRTWQTTDGTGPVGQSIAPTIAAAQNGVIWAAADGELIRFDAASGSIRSVPLLAPGDNAHVESGRPQQIHGVHDIRAVAVDRNGHVAIALSAATQVLIYHDSSGQFTTLALPLGTDAWSVGYFADGSLAIGVAEETGNVATVLVATPDGHVVRSFSVPDASRLLALASESLLAGTLGPSTISEQGSVKRLVLRADVALDTTLGGVEPLSNGGFVVATANRLVRLRADGRIANTYTYPLGNCYPHFEGFPDANSHVTTTSGPSRCPVVPLAMHADRAGNVWMVGTPAPGAPGAGYGLSVLKGL
jgi:hypothetical protein